MPAEGRPWPSDDDGDDDDNDVDDGDDNDDDDHDHGNVDLISSSAAATDDLVSWSRSAVVSFFLAMIAAWLTMVDDDRWWPMMIDDGQTNPLMRSL